MISFDKDGLIWRSSSKISGAITSKRNSVSAAAIGLRGWSERQPVFSYVKKHGCDLKIEKHTEDIGEGRDKRSGSNSGINIKTQ